MGRVLLPWLLIWLKACLFVPYSGLGGGTLREWAMNTAIAALAAGLLMLPPRRLGEALSWLANGAFTMALLVDLLYFRFFDDLPGLIQLEQLGQVPTIQNSIIDVTRALDVLLFADLLLLLPGLLILRLRGRKRPAKPARAGPAKKPVDGGLRRWAVAGLLVLVGVGVGGRTLSNRLETYPGGLYDGVWSQAFFARLWGPLLYHVHDGWRFVAAGARGVSAMSDAEREMVQTRWQAGDVAAATAAPMAGLARGASVINLQVEALQAHVTGLKFRGQAVTPNLDLIAAESLRFERFYHQAAHGRTADAELAVLCGMLPMPAGSAFIHRPDFPQRCLPKVLRDEAGYNTLGYHGHVGRFWNRRKVYPALGIDRFMAKREFEIDEVIHMGLSDQSFLRQVAADLAKQKRPLFAHIITLSSHHPYIMPKEERRLDLGPLEGTPAGDYLHAIHYTDRAIGAFVTALKATGLWQQSVVLIYGDHDMGRVSDDGDSMVKVFGDVSSTFPLRHDWTKRVPLLIRLPGGQKAGTVKRAAGMIDIGPTLLHLLGLQGKGRDGLGSNALVNGPATVPFRSGDVTDGVLLFEAAGDGRPESGRCWRLSADSRLDLKGCLALAARGLQLLKASDLVLDHGLARAALTP